MELDGVGSAQRRGRRGRCGRPRLRLLPTHSKQVELSPLSFIISFFFKFEFFEFFFEFL